VEAVEESVVRAGLAVSQLLMAQPYMLLAVAVGVFVVGLEDQVQV
jgi:hypothetical protein